MKSVFAKYWILILVIQRPSFLLAAFPVERNEVMISWVKQETPRNKIIEGSESKSALKQVKSKRHLVAFAFCLFLGFIGIHDYYLGYDERGDIKLAALSLSYLLFIVGLVGLLAMQSLSIGFIIFLGIAYFGLISLEIWWFVDIVRVLFKWYKPKNGSYIQRKK